MTSTRLRVHVAPVLLALSALTLGGCEASKNVLAPSDAVLSLHPTSLFVAANSATSIRVSLRKTDGAPAQDGTEVVLSASSGDFDTRKVRVSGGEANVQYKASADPGMVRISASSGSVSAEVSIRIGSASPGSLTLFVQPSVLPPGGGDAEIVATVSAPNGSLVVGAPVTFTTSAGTLGQSEVVSDSRGEAKTTLKTTASATVSAKVQTLEASPVTLRVKQPVRLSVSVSPVEPVAGEAARVSVTASVDGQPASGRLSILFGDGGSANLGAINGSGSTNRTYAKEGGYNLTAAFTDSDGFETRDTIRITVKATPLPPTPTPGPDPGPSPSPSPGSGDEINPRSIRWLHRDVSSWPITSRITDVSVSSSQICVDHTGAGRFPTSTFGTIQVEGNVWIFAQFGGQWYGATYDWLRPGQVCKGVTGGELGPDQIRIAPMDGSWRGPRSGDSVGFMVSARARDDVSAGAERTNIAVIRWP